MRQLLLLRHAKSSWDDARMADRDRPLNGRGQRAIATMRRVMIDLGLTPDLILVSTARRTLETLQGLEPWDETPLIEPMEALYLASADQLMTVLRGVAETVRSVLLIGHNPGMHDLALSLTAHPVAPEVRAAADRLGQGFPTAALAEFSVGASWSRIGPGAGRLVRFVTPKEM